jgi:cytoskeleton protein RodZ
MSVDEREALVAESASQATAKATTQTPGTALRRAREQRNFSIQQIADELHLDLKIVHSLEADDFFSLGAPVYARGYLRKYALLVGLDPEAVIAMYERLTDVPPTPTVMPVASAYQPPQRISLRRPLLIVVSVAALALLGWIAVVLIERFQKAPAVIAPAAQSQQSSTAPAPASANTPSTSQPLASAPDVEPTTAETSTAPAAATATEAGVANAVSLRVQFSGSSWIEIYDGADKRLLYDIGQPGQTRTVSGQPPLRVTLGMSSAVTLAVNDRSEPVPRRPGRDATRFTVSADGTVR